MARRLPLARRMGRMLHRLAVMLDPPPGSRVPDKASRLRARFPDAPEAWIALVAERWPFEGEECGAPIAPERGAAIEAHDGGADIPAARPRHTRRAPLRWPRFRARPAQVSKPRSGEADAAFRPLPDQPAAVPAPAPQGETARPVFQPMPVATPDPPRFSKAARVRAIAPSFETRDPSPPRRSATPTHSTDGKVSRPRVRFLDPVAAPAVSVSPERQDTSAQRPAPAMFQGHDARVWHAPAPVFSRPGTATTAVAAPASAIRRAPAGAPRFTAESSTAAAAPVFRHQTETRPEITAPAGPLPWPVLDAPAPDFGAPPPDPAGEPRFSGPDAPAWPTLPAQVLEPVAVTEPRLFAALRPEQSERSWNV